jgi:hypothetical protein
MVPDWDGPLGSLPQSSPREGRYYPPTRSDRRRWISVDLYDQIVTVYEDRQLVFATLVATGGEPFYTRPVCFKSIKKSRLKP